MLKTYTFIHVVVSLIAIITGLVVFAEMILGFYSAEWTTIFLWTTIATNVTGFFFPFRGFKPSYGVGLISLILLALAYQGLYSHHLEGAWRGTYVVTAVLSLYFNVFVLIVQSFQKVPTLNALAPTQTEKPFKLTNAITLVLFIIFGTLAFLHFHPALQ